VHIQRRLPDTPEVKATAAKAEVARSASCTYRSAITALFVFSYINEIGIARVSNRRFKTGYD
jgi:hypothetical protein